MPIITGRGAPEQLFAVRVREVIPAFSRRATSDDAQMCRYPIECDMVSRSQMEFWWEFGSRTAHEVKG
jgi:hypothetical protein